MSTKDLFPAGTIPATAFDVGGYQGQDTYHCANQKTFFTHTAGHTENLPSFDAYPTGKVPSDQFESDYQYEWIFYRNLFPTDFAKTDLSFLAWGGELAKTGAAAPAQIWQLKPTGRWTPPRFPSMIRPTGWSACPRASSRTMATFGAPTA